jgi:hypothetical protein
MRLLVFNAGSSFVKFRLYDTQAGVDLQLGAVREIGAHATWSARFGSAHETSRFTRPLTPAPPALCCADYRSMGSTRGSAHSVIGSFTVGASFATRCCSIARR